MFSLGGVILKKFVVLFTLVAGAHRKGSVVTCQDLGGEDMAKVHLARGAVREATPEECELDKVHFPDSGKDGHTVEEKLREASAKNAELQAKNAELASEVHRLKQGVIEVVKPDAELLRRVSEQEKVIADLQHRIRHNQPLAEEKETKKK